MVNSTTGGARPIAKADIDVVRLRAFPTPEGGGNPAGLVLASEPETLTTEAMQRAAARVGYSETAFVVDGPVEVGRRNYRVRYFSPQAEVAFCGHATIALGVALADRAGPGEYVLDTLSGPIVVTTAFDGQETSATFTSAAPATRDVDQSALVDALDALGLTRDDLDPATPVTEAFAGAWHLVLPVRTRGALARLDRYDFDRLRRLSLQNEWVTVHAAYAESPLIHHVRAPFPYGGVVEDPATGAAAAAYVCYLRALGRVRAPATVTILQGEDLGQPCLLTVTVGVDGPAYVTGTAAPI